MPDLDARIPDDMMPDTPWPDDPDAADPVTAMFAAIQEFAAVTLADLGVLLAPDYDAQTLLLVALRRSIAQLKWAEEILEDEIVRAMPGKEVTVPGVGQVLLRSGASRKAWDREAIVSVLVGRIADDINVWYDPDTADALPPHQVVEGVIGRFMESATPSFKVTGLRQWGVSPDEFCQTTWVRKTIQTPTISDDDLFKSGDDQ